MSKGSPCPLQLLGQLERAVLQHAFAEEWRLMQVQSHQTGQDDEPLRLEDSTFSGNMPCWEAARTKFGLAEAPPCRAYLQAWPFVWT